LLVNICRKGAGVLHQNLRAASRQVGHTGRQTLTEGLVFNRKVVHLELRRVYVAYGMDERTPVF
jgi:hypothetical protein